MSGVSFTLDDEAMRQLLDRVGRVVERPRAAMHALGTYFVTSTQINIERETAPDGSRWPKLSPRTAKARIGRSRNATRRGYGSMLRVTARLFSSISFAAEDASVEWGTNVVYGRIHQLGGTINMPAREGKVSIKKIRGKSARFVRAGIKGAEVRAFTRRAHQVKIPARPYLGVSAGDRRAVEEIVADMIRAEAGA